MFTTKIYYLLDTVSETILASFEAKSEAMARRVLAAFDFEKAKLSRTDCIVLCYAPDISHLETYEEVIKSDFTKNCDELLKQEVFDFEEKK